MSAFAGHPSPLVLAVCLLLLMTAGCAQEREKAIGDGYIGSTSAPLNDRLGAGATAVGAVKAGERVEILQRRRRFARVRTASGLEGWLEERHVISREVYERARQLVSETAARPSQGRAHARATANLHLEPARQSPRLFQLQEGQLCDVLEHRAMEQPLPPGAPQPSAPPPPERPAAKKKGKKRQPTQPSGPKKEDWFLVRGQGKAGWALTRFLDMAIPDEVAQYAEGRAITAWQVLNEVQDGTQKKAQYVWATSQQVGSPYDFDAIRVFTWNTARHRYETAYREHSLRGVYPLTVGREKLAEGEVPTFAMATLDPAGNRITRHFVLLGNKVRRREQVR